MLTELNHITLAVKDLETSLDFYESIGFKLRARWAKGAYLEIGKTWICLALGEPATSGADYTHLAFSTSLEGLASLKQMLSEEVWHQNKSEGKSIYFLDPNGHKLEAHVGNLASRLQHLQSHPYEDLVLYGVNQE